MSHDALAVVIGWLIALVFFLGFIVLLRYINHRERMALIQHGFNPNTVQKRRRSKGILRAGLITMMVGLSLTIGLYPIGFFLPTSITSPLHLGPWLLPGLIPLGVGMALTISYYLEQNSQNTSEETQNNVIPIQKRLDRERHERH